MREHVEETAVKMVKEIGLINLSREELCRRAGIKNGSFVHVVGCNFGEFIKRLSALGVTGPDLPVRKIRANPELRRDSILKAALVVATRLGVSKMTRADVAEEAGVSTGLVTRSLGTMPQLKRDVMRVAVRLEVLPVIAQGLAAGDAHACRAPEELKQKAANSLVSAGGGNA